MMLFQNSTGTLFSSTGMCPQSLSTRAFRTVPLDNEVVEEVAGPWLLGRWHPPVDIDETDEAFIFNIDVPGIANGTLEVLAEAGTVRISGQRKANPSKNITTHRTERQVGVFTRNFQLPHNADTNNIRATYKQGVLRLVIPKAMKAARERTKISLV